MGSRFSNRTLLSTFSALLILIVPALVTAQTDTGSLSVQITWVGGRPAPDATVTITNTDTGQSRTKAVTRDTRTADSDIVFFGTLEPGKYQGRVNYINPTTQLPLTKSLIESPTKQSFIEIDFGTVVRITLQIQIELGIQPQILTVLPPPVVTLNTPQEVTSARRNELLETPNPNRDITPLLQVVPGAIPVGPASLGNVIIDGKGKDQQTLKIDGLDATTMVELPAGDPAIGVLDKLQKQSVTSIVAAGTKSGAFDPIYGPGTGSVSDSVTQGGSAVPKFDIYHVLSNDALNARNFFDYDGKNGLRRSLFGGTLGGTIQSGNSSFFFAYEGIRGRTERNIYEAVPVDALCRCARGPVAPFINTFLPEGTDIMPGASLNSDFLIARRRGRIEAVSNAFNFRLEFKSFAKTGSTPTPGAESKQWHDDIFTLRFTRQSGEILVPDGVTGRLQRQDLLFVNAFAKAKLARGAYVHTLKFGVNQTRGRIEVENSPSFSPTLSQSLITISGSVNTVGLPVGFQKAPIATLGGLVKGIGHGFDLDPISYISAYDGTRQFNNEQHKLSFGIESRFIRLGFDRLGGLTYSFSDLAKLREGATSTIAFLSDLSGPSPFSNGQGQRRARQEYYLGYLQMVSEFYVPGSSSRIVRLTLTYGLRYDYFGTVRERDNRAVVVDPLTGEFLRAGKDFYRAKKNNFQPRLGVAYLLPFDSGLFEKTVLRGNVGMYSGVPRIGDLLLPIESDRFSTGRDRGVFPINSRDIINEFLDHPLTRQFQPLAFGSDFTTPERVYKWDGSLTRTFKVIYDFRVGYSGNIGRNLPLATIGNPIVGVETNAKTSEAVVIRQFDLVRNGDVFKPFGEFFFRTSRGRSSYNAMTISLSRNNDTTNPVPLPSWLQLKRLNVQYTLSRNLGNASGALASDPSNFDSDYGYNASDARHVFKVQATYETSTAFMRGVWSPLGGWTISPTINARSGFPLIVRIERPDVVYEDADGNIFKSAAAGRRAVVNTPGGGASGGARVPDLLPGVNPFIRNGLELLNPAAFAIPRPGQFGNLRRGVLRGPGSFQFDLALSRQLLDAEKTHKISAEFKVEILNIINHANFNNPTALLPNALPDVSLAGQIQPGIPFTRAAAGSFGILNAADPGRQIQFSLSLRLNEGK